ncbi:hypothetical protein GNF51_16905, partial [Clostridium perfringens]|uniref:branched-chain amino acid transport system II carrier protein n=1 Tax=Clostridium perfringens TaxID=1502 RepID=UPI002AC7BDCC
PPPPPPPPSFFLMILRPPISTHSRSSASSYVYNRHSIISLVIATLFVDKIVVLSIPILNVLYPVSITLIATTLLSNLLKNIQAVRLGVYTSLVFGILFASGINLSFIPLADVGFGWVLPT